MKFFLKKILIISILTGSILVMIVSLMPMHFNSRLYARWKYVNDELASIDKFNKVTIGDSRLMAALDPKLVGNVKQLCLPGGTPIEGFYTLSKLIENNAKIDTIVVSYSPNHLEIHKSFFEKALKYEFYEWQEIYEILHRADSLKTIFWASEYRYSEHKHSKISLKARLIYLKNPFYYRSELASSLLLRGVSNWKEYDRIKNNLGYAAFGNKTQSGGKNEEAISAKELFVVDDLIDFYIKKIFALAERHHIHVHYISTPMNQTSVQAISQNYKTSYSNYLLQLSAIFPSSSVETTILTYPNNYFGDPSHLNYQGTLKFSNRLKKLYF